MNPNRPKLSQKTLTWHQIIAMLIVAFAFFMSGLVSERVFERLPHLEDEVAYLYQARIFAGGNIVVDSPQPTNAYWQPFVVDSATTGNRFSKYTPGWSALLAVGVWLGYEQIVNMLLSALTIALVYRLGREIFNADVAIIASLLTAFSPAALLLNGSLMSHSSGLFFTTLFVYAYWRLEKQKRAYIWGAIAGISLGILAATRPLTTLGIALPLIAWSGVRLLPTIFDFSSPTPLLARTFKLLAPLLILSGFALTIASSIPAFSYVATGDASQNLYELVWDYDRIGFGEGYGRNRHRLEKALAHARYDLSLTEADLFGWQFQPFTDEMENHVLQESDYYEGTGYSFYLLPIGALFGLLFFTRRQLGFRIAIVAIWSVVAFLWIWIPQNLTRNIMDFGRLHTILNVDPFIIGDETFSWIWIGLSLLWLFVPLIYFYRFKDDTPQIPYTWLLFSIIGSVVIVQMLYWIGSQRYSTRYYYEALSACALLTAIPIAWLIRLDWRNLFNAHKPKISHSLDSTWRLVTYGIFLGLCVFTLYNYSTPRISALYRFNNISPELIQQVTDAAPYNQPILAIVSGETSGENRVRWRSYGSLMAVTSPYLDSDIVVVRDFGMSRDDYIAQYPDRVVVDVYAVGNTATVQRITP